MTRVTDPDIPPNLVELMRPILVHADGSSLHSATGYLNPWSRQARVTHSQTPSPLALESAARAFIAEWPLVYGFNLNSPHYEAILAGLTARDFAPIYWTPVTPYDDRLEVCTPTWVEDAERAVDPNDPAEIKPTWCTYEGVAESHLFADAGVAPGVPLPGWQTTVENGNWIRDDWFAQRTLHAEFPEVPRYIEDRPVIGHLTGEIRCWASQRGARSWFAPAIQLQFGFDAGFGFPTATAGAGTHSLLVPRSLDLPPEAEPWEGARTLDLVIRLDALARHNFTRDKRWLRLTLSALPTFGRYTAGNAECRCQAALDLAIYLPTEMF